MKQSYLIALLSIASALGFSALPAYADKITTQIINQDVNITGNGNTVNQTAGQISVQNQKNTRNGNSGVVPNQNNYQSIDQYTNVRGNNNQVNQNAQQVNVQNNVNGKKHGRPNAYGRDRDRHNGNQINDQEITQGVNIRGNGNEVNQNAQQVNVQNSTSGKHGRNK